MNSTHNEAVYKVLGQKNKKRKGDRLKDNLNIPRKKDNNVTNLQKKPA